MLPFMNKKVAAIGTVIKERPSSQDSENTEESGLEACAMELIMAIHLKDIKAVTKALRNAFELMELEPHAEGPHTYESQNIKAGENR